MGAGVPNRCFYPDMLKLILWSGSDSEYDAADQPFILRAEQFVQRDDSQLLKGAAKTDGKTLPANLATNKFKLNVTDNHRKLSDYNLQILVDRSMSMRKPDCPGGQSRWNWCGHEAHCGSARNPTT